MNSDEASSPPSSAGFYKAEDQEELPLVSLLRRGGL